MAAANYSTIQQYIDSAPVCAAPCLQAFWNPHVASCGGGRSWPCLCAAATGAPSCVVAACADEDDLEEDLDGLRGSLAAFCATLPGAPTSSTPSLTLTLVPSSILASSVVANHTTSHTQPTSALSLSNSTTTTTTRAHSKSTTTSSSSSSTTTTATATGAGAAKTTDSRVANPLLAGASSFSASTMALVVVGSLWACLAVFSQV